MANLYTGNGAVISVSGELSTAQVKSAMISAIASGDINLGSNVGATASYTSPGTEWETNANAAYQNLLAAYKAIPNFGVPFFISTDQHGRGIEQHRWMNNADVDGMEIININLGDSVQDVFGTDAVQNFLSRTKMLKNFCSVPGNHDYKYGSEEVSRFVISSSFFSTMNRRMSETDGCNYTVLDNAHNVKFILVDTYDDAGLVSGMPHPYVNTETASWLIKELSRNDGYDIVILHHEPVCKTSRTRSETEETEYDDFSLWNLLLERKNKSSGTFVDDDGVSHSYDFSGMDGDLLCTLHGHTHEERISTADGLTAYAADWYGNNYRCTFGLIDRLNSKATFWAFDSTGCLDPLELPV
ncbi:MAG: hypothetical protein IJ422_09470 [Oscillospiraceae bacterium]|nr:hypothetical protein [Oscillospiraceae bacterium]